MTETTSPPSAETAHIPSISTTAPTISPFARQPLQRTDSRSALSPLASQFPHVYHYVNQLFVAAAQESTNAAGSRAGDKAHPLSVSSSTGSHSGGSNSDEEDALNKDGPGEREERAKKSARTVSVSSAASAASTAESSASGGVKLSQEEKDDVVRVIVELLGEEREEQVKRVLKDKLGAIGQVSWGRYWASRIDWAALILCFVGRRVDGPDLFGYHAQAPR